MNFSIMENIFALDSIIAWIDSLVGNCSGSLSHLSRLSEVGPVAGDRKNLSWQMMTLNNKQNTSRYHIWLSLSIDSAMPAWWTDDRSELTGISQAFAHLMHLARNLAGRNDLLDRKIAPMDPGIIHNRLNRVPFERRPVVDIRSKSIWSHHRRALNVIDRIVVRGPDLGLGDNIPLRRYKRFQLKNLVFILVKDLINLAGTFPVVGVDGQHLGQNFRQKQTVSFLEHFEQVLQFVLVQFYAILSFLVYAIALK